MFRFNKSDIEKGKISDTKKSIFKLKKGDLVIETNFGVGHLSIVMMCLDSINLPIDEIEKNYHITFSDEIKEKLKELGY